MRYSQGQVGALATAWCVCSEGWRAAKHLFPALTYRSLALAFITRHRAFWRMWRTRTAVAQWLPTTMARRGSDHTSTSNVSSSKRTWLRNLSLTRQACADCEASCVACTSATDCTECMPGYTLSGGDCILTSVRFTKRVNVGMFATARSLAERSATA